MNFDPDALGLGLPKLRARKVRPWRPSQYGGRLFVAGDSEWYMEKKVKGRWTFARTPTEDDMVLIAAALFRQSAAGRV